MHINAKVLKILTKKLLKIVFWITLILVLLDAHSHFFFESKYLINLFNFSSEKTPATWVSSTLFLLIGAIFFMLFQIEHKKHWFISSFIFVFFSIDDASYFHEQISSWIKNDLVLFADFPSYTWLVTIAPVYVLLILFALYQVAHALRKTKLSLFPLITATCLLGISLIFDFIDGSVLADQFSRTQTHYLQVSEELVEIFALALIFYSVSLLLQERVRHEQ